MFQTTKDAPYQCISFVASPFSNLRHRERLAERVEHGVDVVLTPGAPFRCGEPVDTVWQLLDDSIHRGDLITQLQPLAPTRVLVSQDFCAYILGVENARPALGLGLEPFTLDRSQSFLLSPTVGLYRLSLDLPQNRR